MRQKIKDHYKTEYSSSEAGLTISDDEIDFIIKHDCKCDNCESSIFEMDDFPDIKIESDELLCEDCCRLIYTLICPICEDSYDIYDGESGYEVAIEGDDLYKYPGIYKDAKLVVAIKINEFKKIECGEHCFPVYSDKICNYCAKKYTKKENFLLIDSGIPCILIEKERYGSFFNDWPIERIKRHRKRMIHQRITCRGIIEKANKIEQVEI